jgi:hypothetical protein
MKPKPKPIATQGQFPYNNLIMNQIAYVGGRRVSLESMGNPFARLKIEIDVARAFPSSNEDLRRDP